MARKQVLVAAVAAVIVFSVVGLAWRAARRAERSRHLVSQICHGELEVRIREDMRREIADNPDRAAIRALIEELDQTDSFGYGGRRVAISLLMQIGEPAVKPLLLALERRQIDLGELRTRIVERAMGLPPSKFGDLDQEQRWNGVASALASMGTRAVPGLVKTLRSRRAVTRAYAAQILGKIAAPSTVDALASAAKDADPMVRWNAVWALAAIDDERVCDIIIGALRDTDPAVRATAVCALGRRSEPAAAEALAATMTDSNVTVAQAALLALGRKRDPRAFDGLCAMLRSPSLTEVEEAARVMSIIGDKPSLDALASLDESAPQGARILAGFALGRTGDARGVPGLELALTHGDQQRKREAAELLAFLKSDSSIDALIATIAAPGIRIEDAEVAASRLAVSGAPGLVPALIRKLKDPDEAIRKAASHTMELTPVDERMLAPLLDAFENDPCEEVRGHAGFALRLYHSPEALEVKLRMTGDPLFAVRKGAMDALSTEDDPRAHVAIVAALDDETPQVRAAALRALALTPQADALPKILERLEDQYQFVRERASITIATLRDPRAADALIAAVGSDNAVVRQNAIRGLLYLQLDHTLVSVGPVIDAFKRAARQPADAVAAVFALCLMGTPEADSAVSELLDGRDAGVAAADYVSLITGGSNRDLVLLAAALARNGGVDMARDFYRCRHKDLSMIGAWWSVLKNSVRVVQRVAEGPDAPVWRSGRGARLAGHMDDLEGGDETVRLRAARSLGYILDRYAPRLGASVLSDEQVAIPQNVESPSDLPRGGGYDFDISPAGMEAAERKRVRSEYSREDIVVAIGALAKASMEDSDARVRVAAVRGLGMVYDPIVIEPLSRALRDPDPEIAKSAGRGLARVIDKRSVPPLIEGLKYGNPSVVSTCVDGLAQQKDPSAIPALLSICGDEDRAVRMSVALALAVFKDARAVSALEKLLDDGDTGVMAGAAIGLETVGTSQARAAVDRRAEGADLAEVARGYRRYITEGDESKIVVLILALARYCGDNDLMLRHYKASGNPALKAAAHICDYGIMQRGGQYVEHPPDPEGPRWPGTTPPEPD